MGEPARNLPDEDKPNIRPNLHVLNGGGQSSEPTGNLSTAQDRVADASTLQSLEGGGETSAPRRGHLSSIGSKEDSDTSSTAKKLGRAEAGSGGELASFFSGEESKLSPLKRFRIGKAVTRKKGIGAAISLLLGGGIFFGAGIASGPLQVMHYGQLLAGITPFQHQQSATDGRMSKLIRWANTRDVGETRLSTLGSILMKKTRADFAKHGVTIVSDPINGQIRSIAIDADAEGSKYAGLDPDEMRARIAADNGISVDSVKRISGLKNKFGFAATNISTTNKRGILAGFVDDQKLGKISNYTRFRTLSTYYNTPNWFHPIQKISAKVDQKLSAALRAKALKADEKSRLKKLVAKSDATKAFNESLRKKISPNGFKAVAGGLIVSQAICIGKDIVEGIPAANRANVIVPSIVSAVDGAALGDQARSRQDTTLDQIGAATVSFRSPKDGSTPWQSQAIQNIQHNTSSAPGVATPKGISQAYSGDSNAKDLDKALDKSGGNLLCNPVSQALQGAAGLALLFTGAGGVVEKGAQLAFSFGVGLVIGALSQSLTQLLADDPITGVPHQGSTGGAVDAYGIIAAANSNAVAKGGVKLTGAQTAELDQMSDINGDFKSQSFASRIFNIHDYRSFASRSIDAQNPEIAYNATNTTASVLTGMTHFGSAFSSLASALLPHAQAAPTTPYGLGQPEYGKSASMLNNANFENPYDNAEIAAKLFDNDTNGYIEKAKTCFGVDITKDSNGKWGAVGVQDVNVATAEYDEANCGDTDLNWQRVAMFTGDTADMEGYACVELNDGQSCVDDGFNRAVPDQSAVNDPNAVDQKTMYDDSSTIACADGTTDAGIQDGYHSGKKVKIRICGVPGISSSSDESHGGYGSGYTGGDALVNSRVSANFLALAQAAKKDGVTLSASSSFRTMAHQQSLCPCDGTNVAVPGTSNHQMGVAIDFTIPSHFTGTCNNGRDRATGDPMWDWLNKNAATWGVKQYGHEAWHWDTLADSTRCGGDGS